MKKWDCDISYNCCKGTIKHTKMSVHALDVEQAVRNAINAFKRTTPGHVGVIDICIREVR